MNIITFDTEEWYIEKMYRGGRQEKYDTFDRLLNEILDLLDERHLKATFFCVGQLAPHFPKVIKLIQSRGHEIGCHSNAHQWLNKMTQEEVLNDTKTAVDSLEQLTGEKVKSYRAPAFSIGKNNAWSLEILAECGIERDASIFPTSRDFGGFADFASQEPTLVTINGKQIKEFPITTARIGGKDLAYSGGGYFRLFPYWFVQQQMRKASYTMTYFHINDLIADHKFLTKEDYERYFKESGTLLNRTKRYIKSSLGTSQAFPKLQKLIRQNDFINLAEADKQIDWNTTPQIKL